ncbi:MAG: hypothetical protein VZR09_05805 [Candidatus Gastranaerophilaceae bacterium]|jgi:Skp family chaperone for outer membrane proteins|nr:hypothetical protein [Candidatus Gastranaerophilaceae bacterium]
MNKSVKFLTVAAVAFGIGLGVNNFAMSEIPGSYRVAVVDVQQVVAASSQVNELRKENQAMQAEIISFVEKARKDVASASDVDKKKSLEEKYSKELNSKREAFGAKYTSKMVDIQNNILNAVTENAKANNYDIVIAKDVVLYGGEDITDSLKSAVAAIKPAAKKTKSSSKKK